MAKSTFREWFGRWLLGKDSRRLAVMNTRMYSNARGSRSTTGFGMSGNTSADAELSSSLTQLRARSRQMVRDNPYAKRAKSLIVNNVIGPGVGMQAQVVTTRDELAARVNDEIEALWSEWCEADACHIGGKLHFNDLERLALGQVFEAGEILFRKHYSRFGNSRVPLSLEVIEAERLASEFDVISAPSGNQVRMGVEIDRFGRAVAYYFRVKHPGDIRWGAGQAATFERVVADDVFHLYPIDRWPQTRGEPWMHTVLAKLDLMNEYSAAEVQAARDSSYYFATIEREQEGDGVPLADGQEGNGTPTYEIAPGMIQHLDPGEKLEFHAPNRPNTAIDAFLRYMLREVAAGVGPSYAALSQDYSQTNYSSSRLALLDDRDSWRVLQQWWIRSFRQPLHRLFMQQAVFAGELKTVPIEQWAPNRRKFEAVLFKPRGWSWIDPGREVSAFRDAEKAGYITKTQIIAQTANGMDIEDVVAERKRELKLFEDAELYTDTVPTEAEVAPTPAPAPAAPPPDDGQDPAADDARNRRLDRIERSIDLQTVLRMVPPSAPVSMTIEPGAIAVNLSSPPVVVERTEVNVSPPAVHIAPSTVNVTTPDIRIQQDAPVINVAPAEVRIEQAPPVVNVAAPEVRIEQAPAVVNVAPTELHLTQHPRRAVVTHEHDAAGELSRSVTQFEDFQTGLATPPQRAVVTHERDAAGELIRSTTHFEE